MRRIMISTIVFLMLAPVVSGREGPMTVKKATFAGGCFWCMQPSFDRLKGVVRTTVGYSGGDTTDPSYEEVSTGRTGHLEAVEVEYDPSQVSYKELLRAFWLSIDPTDPGGQFADQGSQYRTAIFYHDEEQKSAAEDSKKELAASNRFHKPIATAILPAKPFYPAEEHHQKYYQKNVLHYKLYKKGSGREDYLKRAWGAGQD
jgi:peptide methionine sulfoxide reductase msrA/msrB